MLDLATIDLCDLSLALEDHSHEHTWWLDPVTGEVSPRFSEPPHNGGSPVAALHRLVAIEPLPAAVGYGDMEDFVSCVRDPHARYLLEKAIVGRGAFRRFKDTLLDFPELRGAWFAFHDTRGERRAIAWLADRGLIDGSAAKEAIAERPDPDLQDVPGFFDPQGVARRVALDLRRLYKERLKAVLLLPWARSDGGPEPIELVVVLDSVPDPWQEKRQMEQIMWRHSVRNDAVVTEVPVTDADLEAAATPLLARAASGAVPVE